MKKTLGGDRLGAGKQMQVELHGYERSTHDLGYLWRSTMSTGTLVPFLSELGLPGDTFDINLNCEIKTHPTIGPLFGSEKVQLDIFQCPIRLYQGQLHNNKLGIGMNMAAIKLPQILLKATPIDPEPAITPDLDNAQINPSCILSYLGIRGVGNLQTGDILDGREFNGIPFLAYWDIYKNYYANKQEEIGAVIHATVTPVIESVVSIGFDGTNLPQAPASEGININNETIVELTYVTATGAPNLNHIFVQFGITGPKMSLAQLTVNQITAGGAPNSIITMGINSAIGNRQITSWNYLATNQLPTNPPEVVTFPLENIDLMREAILADVASPTAFIVNVPNIPPYDLLLNTTDGQQTPYMQNQEGLALKTYQSDLFNNWLQTEWIDGTGGISEVTSIDTSGGSFSLDTLNLSKKVYDMLNRIAVSGGSYDDWLDAVYTHDRYQRAESPMYMGGLIKELVFQEITSNAEASGGDSGTQPLGTLAGKGTMAKKHKGGNVTIKVDEPSWIIGIISLTPRIDYSQGNKWDVHLKTMDDLHKPALDEIGFQELITEQMAWWSTEMNAGVITTKSAGKQPAWINYMTNVNQTKGNFAIENNEMFMTFNRRYERDITGALKIKDLTTYIDPVKFNHIFAQTSIDAQNYWAQIAVDITARRKMSGKIMPNL